MTGEYLGPLDYEASDYHLSGLEPDTRQRWEQMAGEYYAATGEPLRMRSGYRSTEHQARLYAADPKSGYVAPPGNSTHEHGEAIDLDKSQVSRLEKLGLIDKYFNRPLMGQTKSGIKEPWHIEHPMARVEGKAGKIAATVGGGDGEYLGPLEGDYLGPLEEEPKPQLPAAPFSTPETSVWPEKYKVGNLLNKATANMTGDATSDTLAQFAEPAGEMVGKAVDLPFVPLRKGLEFLHKTAIEPSRERTIAEWADAMKPGGALEGAGAAAPEAFAALPSKEAFVPVMEAALAPAYLKMISKGIGLFAELGPAFRRHAPDIFFKYTAKGGLPVPLSPDTVAEKLMAMSGPERAAMARKYPQFREVMEEMTSLVSKKREPYSPEFAARVQGAGEGLPFPENVGETFTMKEPPAILRKAQEGYTTPVAGPEPDVWLKSRGKATMTPETFKRRLLDMAEDLPDSAGLRTSPPITMQGPQANMPEWLKSKIPAEPTPTQTLPPEQIAQQTGLGEVAPESQAGRGVGEVGRSPWEYSKAEWDQITQDIVSHGEKKAAEIPKYEDEANRKVQLQLESGKLAKLQRQFDNTQMPSEELRNKIKAQQEKVNLIEGTFKKQELHKILKFKTERQGYLEKAQEYEDLIFGGEIKINDKSTDFPVTISSHKDVIRKALAAGEKVPESVLADYPDLAAKYTPTLPPEAPGGVKKMYSGGPDTSEIFKKIVKQRKLTIDKPAFDELFIDRKDAKAFLKTEGHNPDKYLIRKTKDNNYTIHERVPRVPLYEDMAEISEKLAKAPDLDAWFTGKAREKGSFEPAIGTFFSRLERHAPGITEKVWYRAHELDTQAEARYQDLLEELKPLEKSLGFNSSKRIDAWAVAQQENGPETLAKMKVKVKPLTNTELAYYERAREIYNEILDEINEARMLAGKQPIARREDYSPFIRKFNELIGEEGDPINIDAEYFHPLSTPFKYAKARIGGTRKLELDFVRHLKQYMRAAYRHIELSPHIATVREMGNKIELPKGTVTLRDESPITYKFLEKWTDRVAGVKEVDWGPGIDKLMNVVAHNNVVATLGGLITTAAKQPSSMLQAWAKTSHDVGYTRGSKYMIAGIKDSLNPNKWVQAKRESQVLSTRELDTSLESMKGRVDSAAFALTGFMDMQAAVASWWAARRAAKHMGLSGKAAIMYADMSVIRTQASASPIDRAPFQSRPTGRFLGQFQTFVINDFDFIKKEILGINGPVDLSTAQKIGRLMMFAGGAALINAFYRDILGINPPLPEPITAAKRELKKGKGVLKAGQAAISEFTKMVPLAGGMQYGSGMLGAGPALLADIGRLVTGSEYAPSPWKIAGKLLGVPGTEQANKLIQASKGKITQKEALFGRQPKEKTKKRRKSGFGGF